MRVNQTRESLTVASRGAERRVAHDEAPKRAPCLARIHRKRTARMADRDGFRVENVPWVRSSGPQGPLADGPLVATVIGLL